MQRAGLEGRGKGGYRLEVRLVFEAGGRATLIEERSANTTRQVEWNLVCERGRLGNPPAGAPSSLFERDLEHFVRRVRERKPNARVFAVAGHEEEVAELIDAGAEAAWNMYSEAGSGLASEVISYYGKKDNSQ